jgi:hypothetical protein
MTDHDPVDIDDAAEWVTEPADESELYLDRDALDDAAYQTAARDVTRAVLSVHPREAAALNVLGLTDALREIDNGAIEMLARDSQLTVTGKQLSGKTEATREVIDAILALYSGPLLTVSIYSADGTAIVARRDGNLLWCWLPESALSALARRLDDHVFEALRPR